MTNNNIAQIDSLQEYSKSFVSSIPKTPMGKYASIIMLRETKSYAIFTTEGGQQQDIERTQAGLTHSDPMDRLVMFKRKQVAPERRTGKALMRQYGVFPYAMINDRVVYGEEAKKKDKTKRKDDCYLTAGLCGHCTDCMTYGYAAIEGEGSRRSRVMTDSCFSVRPYALIQKGLKFNVIDEKKQTSSTITEYDYTSPQVFLPAVVTTVDLTMDEFVYILINLMRTTRYGKESSRQGFMRNHILAVAFSDMELFSNLEFSQCFYDAFESDTNIDLLKVFLSKKNFDEHAPAVIQNLTEDFNGRLQIVTNSDYLAKFGNSQPTNWTDGLDVILSQTRNLSKDESSLTEFLRQLNTQSVTFARSISK
ncbi:MAG: type I-D CRISPR-associated protein Cas7/Csc2 [Roseofilum sp. SBFL]|uniref:type I-D CRISPR-associated protein Cas7/Csc2 n=1 Tax=unclassified Roseofilum TaxID=2620099 RepID=UPI000E9628B2|nr:MULTISPECIES: type I-D CRISPR-associated protein Cas7/Csc2 [unclassified Roseofilum]MBP0013792.1 type I-D CRISPR-associated protein Cas7/Csc2 [Roseofilum sp. SID3]MBP0026244.1 type I-D CRISPR-associated protein Cas7/Csc2 [Roseofilum sp. SID2]MBP0040582.1 type I-D CRISPR-associated protein Cas7/Csc2 [Roseofilum sp. SBFL]HBR00141.1 type I-D CRISPR-associated protein Cas7/Csc2 [Cyanobacteria bacterium UBA11691]